jgi:hypothetical protein
LGVWCCLVWLCTVCCLVWWLGVVRFLCDLVLCGVVLCGVRWFCRIWCGLVWSCAVWCGLVWSGVVSAVAFALKCRGAWGHLLPRAAVFAPSAAAPGGTWGQVPPSAAALGDKCSCVLWVCCVSSLVSECLCVRMSECLNV